MPRSPNFRPLYRTIVRDALHLAWKEKRLWPFALLAGFIQLGGIYDTLLLRLRSFGENAKELSDPTIPHLLGQLQGQFFLNKVFAIQGLTLFAVIMIAVCLFSVIAQGTLILGLDSHGSKPKKSLKELLRHAAHHLIPLLTINVVGVGTIWIIGFLTTVPLLETLSHPSITNVFAYLSLFVLLVGVTVIFTSWHMLALNALLVDELTFTEAFGHAWRVMKHSWLTILETAILLIVTSLAIYLVVLLGGILINTPAMMLLMASVLLVMPKLYLFLRLLVAASILILLALAGLYTITFQYATWNRLYERISEGTAHAKFHRFIHWVNGHLTTSKSRF